MNTWVDLTIINSVMAGLLLMVGGLWAWYAMTRLHQLWLAEQAEAALDAAELQGLVLAPTGLRARLVATGRLASGAVRVEWRTGLLGPRTIVWRGGRPRRYELLRTADQLDRALTAAAAAS